MTIASEITRINNNIAAAYTAASGKGATLPATENSDNLATCIGSIPSGGGVTPVNVSVNNIAISGDFPPFIIEDIIANSFTELVIYPTQSDNCLAYLKDGNGDIVQYIPNVGSGVDITQISSVPISEYYDSSNFTIYFDCWLSNDTHSSLIMSYM